MYLTRKEAAYFADRAYGILQPICFVSPRVSMGLPLGAYIPYIQRLGSAVCTFGDIQAGDMMDSFGSPVTLRYDGGSAYYSPKTYTGVVAIFFHGVYAN